MQSDHTLHSATEMLKKSDEISSIVTALAKAKDDRNLDSRNKRALREGLSFLEDVEEGYNWMEEATPSVNKESRLRAQSLNAAIDSWELEENTGHFLEDVEHMRETIRNILEDGESCNDISPLVDFFNNILNSNLDRIDGMYSNSILGRNNNQWMYANA